MKKRIKINGVLIFFAFVLLVLLPKIFFRDDKTGSSDTPTAVAGLVLVLLGQLIRVSSRGYKAEHSQQGNVLIMIGPYSFVRNPMYLGIFLIGLGVCAMLFQWWVACLFIFIFIIRYILLIFEEENKLDALFPDVFPYYKQKTPRLFPSIPSMLKADITEYLPLKLYWLEKEIGSISTLLLIVISLKSWLDIINKGLKEYAIEAVAMLAVIAFFVYLIFHLNRHTKASRCCK